jgi:hypothetical protein
LTVQKEDARDAAAYRESGFVLRPYAEWVEALVKPCDEELGRKNL